MTQTELPLFRNTDGQTSRETKPNIAGDEAICFGVIFDMGEHGATAKDIAKYSRLTDVQANRRLGNMGERGLIYRKQVGTGIGKNGAYPIYEARGRSAIWWRAK